MNLLSHTTCGNKNITEHIQLQHQIQNQNLGTLHNHKIKEFNTNLTCRLLAAWKLGLTATAAAPPPGSNREKGCDDGTEEPILVCFGGANKKSLDDVGSPPSITKDAGIPAGVMAEVGFRDAVLDGAVRGGVAMPTRL